MSYEDIKSAEAAIKGNTSQQKSSPNISTNETNTNENNNSQNSLVAYPQSTTSTYNFSQNTPTQQGVSSLSSLFGESKVPKNQLNIGLNIGMNTQFPTNQYSNNQSNHITSSINFKLCKMDFFPFNQFCYIVKN